MFIIFQSSMRRVLSEAKKNPKDHYWRLPVKKNILVLKKQKSQMPPISRIYSKCILGKGPSCHVIDLND